MPVYSYHCINCDTSIDIPRPVEQRDTYAACQTCGYQLARNITVPAVTFKGSGFYRTDKDK